MASRLEKNDVTIEVSGPRIPKFKAGTELSGKVNSIYVDTNEGSQDGADYEYTVTFKIINTSTDL
jgi:hypothetical protein